MRISEFLATCSKDSSTSTSAESTKTNSSTETPVVVEKATWKYESVKDNDEEEEPFSLSNIDLKFERGKRYAIVGSVGSGKSSLLSALNREIGLKSGSFSVTGRIAYCTQRPWIISGTVKNNILFQQPFDGHRFAQVLAVCGLDKDIERLPNGIETVIGERGLRIRLTDW